jgi:hypothetical protein
MSYDLFAASICKRADAPLRCSIETEVTLFPSKNPYEKNAKNAI